MVGELQAGDPRSVGPYRLLGRLGVGGMGQVFLGRSAGGRLVAVKVIRPELAGEAGFRARFAREVAAARNVSGMFTALVINGDVSGPVPWLATAYVPGPSLAEAVETQGPLPAQSVFLLAAGLAEGLQAIHAAGVVHRDLKPSNVLLADDGPRVIDFGISRAAEASMLTQSGTVVGSPGFMSPEQAEGDTVGPPSDVFSLGAVLTFAATGEGPFGTGSTPALIYRVVHREPDVARLPDELRGLVLRCLAKDPDARPTTAQLLDELGVGQLDADWLPAALTQAISRYAPPAAAAGAPAGVASPAGPGVAAAAIWNAPTGAAAAREAPAGDAATADAVVGKAAAGDAAVPGSPGADAPAAAAAAAPAPAAAGAALADLPALAGEAALAADVAPAGAPALPPATLSPSAASTPPADTPSPATLPPASSLGDTDRLDEPIPPLTPVPVPATPALAGAGTAAPARPHWSRRRATRVSAGAAIAAAAVITAIAVLSSGGGTGRVNTEAGSASQAGNAPGSASSVRASSSTSASAATGSHKASPATSHGTSAAPGSSTGSASSNGPGPSPAPSTSTPARTAPNPPPTHKAPPPPAAPDIAGTWSGTYTCNQGATGMTLTVSVDSASTLSAVFSFYAIPSNPSVVSGSFAMNGTYTGSSVSLIQSHWIHEPTGYLMVDLFGSMPSGDSWTGSVVATSGCSTFSVSK